MPLPAHLRFAAVGIERTHSRIGILGMAPVQSRRRRRCRRRRSQPHAKCDEIDRGVPAAAIDTRNRCRAPCIFVIPLLDVNRSASQTIELFPYAASRRWGHPARRSLAAKPRGRPARVTSRRARESRAQFVARAPAAQIRRTPRITDRTRGDRIFGRLAPPPRADPISSILPVRELFARPNRSTAVEHERAATRIPPLDSRRQQLIARRPIAVARRERDFQSPHHAIPVRLCANLSTCRIRRR